MGAVDPEPAELARVLAYLDGELTREEQLRFELELAADPELAARVTALAETDDLVRRFPPGSHAAAGPRPTPVLRWAPLAWAVAAVLVVALGLATWLLDRGGARDLELAAAVLPGFTTAGEFVDHHPDLRGLRPPGLEEFRSAGEAPNVEAARFVTRALAAEREEMRAALSAPDRPVAAGYFSIPVEAPEALSVVVLAIPSEGPPERLWPSPDDGRPPASQGRLEPGLHLLPSPRVALEDGERPRVSYAKGFLVPLGAGELTVRVAARRQPLDRALLDRLDAALPEGAAALDAALRRAGFSVRERTVLEPQ